MQVEKFSFEVLQNKFYEQPVEMVRGKEIRKVSDGCIKYINKYFFQSVNDNYYFWNAESKQFVLHTAISLKSVYFSKLPNEINFYFFKERTALYEVVSEVNKPRVYDEKINTFEGLKYENVKPFEEYSTKTKEGVNLYLSYMKEVLCSNNQESFDYIMKWVANMCKGNKNDSCLYLKGIEGIGKSSFSDFLKEYVLGPKISTLSKTDTLRSPFNKILCGKLLVVFEELPRFSDNEWEAISSILKDYITGSETLYADKNEKQFKARNINNYIINSNVDAIKHSEGRRYYILDLSTKRKGDFEYFGKLKNTCFNNKVGEAFYSYCLEIDTKGFIPQNMPTSIGKLNAIAERLDFVYQFLKDEFVLQEKGMRMTVNELHDLYKSYCVDNCKKALGKIKFCTKLKEIQIEYRPSNGKNIYAYSQEQLADIAEKGRWIHELDSYSSKKTKAVKSHDLDDDSEDTYEKEQSSNKKIQDLEKQLKKCNDERVINKISLWLSEHGSSKQVKDLDNIINATHYIL